MIYRSRVDIKSSIGAKIIGNEKKNKSLKFGLYKEGNTNWDKKRTGNELKMIGQTSHYSTPDHWVIYEFSAIASVAN